MLADLSEIVWIVYIVCGGGWAGGTLLPLPFDPLAGHRAFGATAPIQSE
jgi:hypothetical protein